MNDMGVLSYYAERKENDRVEYIRDLYRLMVDLEGQAKDLSGRACLQQMLEQAALTAGEPDQRLKNNDRIPIITVHQAKGSEFEYVIFGRPSGRIIPKLVIFERRKTVGRTATLLRGDYQS